MIQVKDPITTARIQKALGRMRSMTAPETIEAAVQENSISPANFILPLFVHEGDKNQPIPSMPGVERLSFENGLTDFVSEARSYGVNQVVVFPKVCLSHGVNRVVAYPKAHLPPTSSLPCLR